MLKKIMVSLLALITAFGMLTGTVFAEDAADDQAQEEVQAEETAADDEITPAEPVQGSWVLYEVYEIKDNADPVLLKKEENQSLYGSGIGIFTFDEDGAAHHNMIDGGGNLDKEASWGIAEPSVYAFTEDTQTMMLRYMKEDDTLHRTFADGERKLDFVYARAFLGSWKLEKVMEIHEGDAPTDLPKEENQSLYGAGESILTFMPEGKANTEVTDGPDKVVTEGTWKMNAPDSFIFTEDTIELPFSYFRVDDTIFRDFKDDAPDASHAHLRFIYNRVIPEPKAEEQETKAAQAETKAAQTETKAAEPAKTNQNEDELIADGQIFTGFEMYLYDPDTGAAVLVKELNQGGYADENTGVIYYQEGGGGDHYYSENGSVLISEWLYMNSQNEEEELINGGQIFTGFEMDLYDPDTGEVVHVKELNQGGYADENSGVIYYQEGGGGDHYYSDDNDVLVSEWLYHNMSDDTDDYMDDTDESEYIYDEDME